MTTQDRIIYWQNRIESLERAVAEDYEDFDAVISLQEARDQLNFAWQDDEAEQDY